MAKKKKARHMTPVSTPELKKKSIVRLKELAGQRERPLIWYHRVGIILNRDVPVVAGKKPRGAIRAIAEEYFDDVGFASTLYGCRQFARVVDRDEVRLDMKGLSWAVAHYLMSVSDKEEREKLIEQSRNLTARQVRLLIQEQFEREKSKAGRRLKVPILTPKTALRESARLSREWIAFCGPWLNSAAMAEGNEGAKDGKWKEFKKDLCKTLTCLKKAVAQAVKRWASPPKKKPKRKSTRRIGKSRLLKRGEPRSRSREIGRKKSR